MTYPPIHYYLDVSIFHCSSPSINGMLFHSIHISIGYSTHNMSYPYIASDLPQMCNSYSYNHHYVIAYITSLNLMPSSSSRLGHHLISQNNYT